MNETQKTIRFVREHSHELIDAINDVCAVAQALLNSGTKNTYADVYKTKNDDIIWTLGIDCDNSHCLLTKDGIIPASVTKEYTFLWAYVMENLSGDDFWNDHYYSEPLPYDSSEINTAIELIQMYAMD